MNAFKKTTADVIGSMHPLFRGLLWVAVARSTDEDRYTLNHILIEREDLITRIVATDGRRLHCHEYDAGLFEDDICDDMIEPGLYEVISKSKKFIVIAKQEDESLAYPKYECLLPDKNDYWAGYYSDVVYPQTTGLICVRTGLLLASDYLKDACAFGCGAKENIQVDYGSEGPGKPLIIKHEFGRAMVMPISWSEESEDEKDATAHIPGLEPDEPEEDEEDEEETESML